MIDADSEKLNSTLANEVTGVKFGCRVIASIGNKKRERVFMVDLKREEEMKIGIDFEWDEVKKDEVLVREGLSLKKGDRVELELSLDKNITLNLKVAGVLADNGGKFAKDEVVDYVVDISHYGQSERCD